MGLFNSQNGSTDDDLHFGYDPEDDSYGSDEGPEDLDDIYDNLSLCSECGDKYTDDPSGLCNDCQRQHSIDNGEGMEGF